MRYETGGSAAQQDRHLDAARNRQIGSQASGAGLDIQNLAGTHPEGLVPGNEPPIHMSFDFRAGERNQCVGEKP